MYLPQAFTLSDKDEIARLLGEHDFAILVTDGPAGMQASHLPLLHTPEGEGYGRLLGHLAAANPQAKQLATLAEEDGEAMAIFRGPHAYVSPRDYVAAPSVPTWNYLAIHAYGRPRAITSDNAKQDLLARLVAHHEAGRRDPWTLDSVSTDFVARMLRGIFAFEIEITRLIAKAKLSQNRSLEDREAVWTALRDRGDPDATATAAWMARSSFRH